MRCAYIRMRRSGGLPVIQVHALSEMYRLPAESTATPAGYISWFAGGDGSVVVLNVRTRSQVGEYCTTWARVVQGRRARQ